MASSIRLAVPVPITACMRLDMHAHRNLHIRCTQGIERSARGRSALVALVTLGRMA